MERRLFPELHQELCEAELKKMAKTGRANFVISISDENTSLVPKRPYERLHFLSFSKNPHRSLRRRADGHWVLESSENTIESIAQQLPEVIKECYPNAVAGIKVYSLSTSQNKPPVITVEAT